MGSIGILTDSSAQFPRRSFAGANDVIIVPLQIEARQAVAQHSQNPTASAPAPKPALKGPSRLATPPSEKLREALVNAAARYDEMIAIVISSQLLNFIADIQEAASSISGGTKIQLIDSQTTSAGLGYLVQYAAEAAAKGKSAFEIERMVRGQINHNYAILCTPNLSSLNANGFTDHAQAIVGEMLGLMALFTIEDGTLTPLEKARNHRHTADLFQEFISEFEQLKHIAFLQSSPANETVIRLVREFAQQNYQKTPFSEHFINPALAALFGPHSLGIFLVEAAEN